MLILVFYCVTSCGVDFSKLNLSVVLPKPIHMRTREEHTRGLDSLVFVNAPCTYDAPAYQLWRPVMDSILGEVRTMSTHPRWGTNDRAKSRDDSSPTWWISDFYFGSRNLDEELLTGAGIHQRPVHSKIPQKHGWQSMKTGYGEHTTQPAKSSASWMMMSFPSSSVNMCLFLES